MIVTIDLASDRPLYLQIADGVRSAIAHGTVRPGDRLPPGRELAASLDVNLETVQRAYRLLASEGIVSSRVGRGTRVNESVDVGTEELVPYVDELVERARSLGITTADLLALVEQRTAG